MAATGDALSLLEDWMRLRGELAIESWRFHEAGRRRDDDASFQLALSAFTDTQSEVSAKAVALRNHIDHLVTSLPSGESKHRLLTFATLLEESDKRAEGMVASVKADLRMLVELHPAQDKPQRAITPSEFARLAGVNPSTVTRRVHAANAEGNDFPLTVEAAKAFKPDARRTAQRFAVKRPARAGNVREAPKRSKLSWICTNPKCEHIDADESEKCPKCGGKMTTRFIR